MCKLSIAQKEKLPLLKCRVHLLEKVPQLKNIIFILQLIIHKCIIRELEELGSQ